MSRRLIAAALVLAVLAACAVTPPAPIPDPSIGPVSSGPVSSGPAAVAPALAHRVARGPEQLVARGPLARPAQPALAARYEDGLLADHCLDRDVPAPPAGDVSLTVLDRSYALPPGYAPPDLVPASTAGLDGSSGTKLVRSVLVEDLAAMRAAWEAAGLTVIVESAYRSFAAQAATFDGWASRLGQAEALVRSARPGHSEHQLGTAIDVTSPGWADRFGDWGREAPEGVWMARHAWENGFVMSDPAGSQAATCFSYEPWHYRWVGREVAADHRASGLQLRQFLERYVDD